jgi:hypothetical protein
VRPDTASAIRAQLIAAMQRRGASLDGEARHALAARLAELRSREPSARDPGPGAAAAPTPPGPLRELLDTLAREAPAGRTAYPEVPALAGFRQLWSTLRADSQLRQSVVHAPADAGPLNSAALASRAIALMRELSPGYLRSFIAYVDDLAWLDRLGSPGPAATSATPRKRAPRKRRSS